MACAALATLPSAWADVGPPVKITLKADSPQAVAGQPYVGVWRVQVGAAGALSDFDLSGAGWKVISFEPPQAPYVAAEGIVEIPFRAVPTDADSQLRLTLRYDGQKITRAYELGPKRLDRRDRAGRVQVIGKAPVPYDDQSSTMALGGAIPLRFTGRFVYQRSDGEIVGADSIRVEVFDDDGLASDPTVDEVIWTGATDQNGFFDSGVVMWDDCDVVGCDDPDIYVHFECDTAIAQVQTSDINETDYFWRTMDNIIENFTGSEVDFGTIIPADANTMGAVHIWNSIIRAHRFIQDRSNIDLPIVDVQWPESEDGAYYTPIFEEIHIGPNHTWREGTHTHEYGHHFLENRAVNPTPDYCNGFCDGDSSGCDFDAACPDEGHCSWCPETDHDAFNEGWPDWLGDVIPRDYPNRYSFDDGSPYEAISGKSYENLEACCVDDLFYSPILTEGFVAALLRDIEDGTQDDHDDDPDPNNVSFDGVLDLLCLGSEEILYITDVYEPVTVIDFINGFLAEYPQHTGRLWATAFNVGGAAYVASFPADTQAPGVVAFLDSSTHPLGFGGSLPCATFEFDPAPDDARGPCNYSYIATIDPAGVEPDEVADFVFGTNDCRLSGVAAVFQLGDFYISIKAQDNAGTWSNNFATFGPFEVTDCNGNGVLDACDINCCDPNNPQCASVGLPGCSADASICPPGSCGTSSDCNGNLIPDECDIASGTSEDCNLDGIPDDCQPNMKQFLATSVGNEDRWEVTANWENTQVPQDDDIVCIRSGIPTTVVEFKEDFKRLESLACEIDFVIDGSSAPAPELSLTTPSFINGGFAMIGNSTLTNNSDLQIDGMFGWADGIMRGTGTTTVDGGMILTFGTVDLWSPHHLIINDGFVAAGSRLMTLGGSAKLTIGTGVTYTYGGDFSIFNGSTTTTIDIDGTLLRTSGVGDVQVYSFVDNSGLIHNQTDELVLFYGGLHSGTVLGDPGTKFTFGGAHEMLPGSSLTVDDLDLIGSGNIEGNVNITGMLKADGGAWNITPGANVTSYGQDLLVKAGTLRLQAPTAEPTPQFNSVAVGQGASGGNAHFETGAPMSFNTLHLVKGSFNGIDPITINNSFTWNSGSINAGGVMSCNGPMTVQSNGSTRNLYRIFNNAGYATFLNAISPQSAGRFNNLASGTVDLQTDSGGLGSGFSTNAGLVVKSGGAGRSTVSGLDNSGLVHVQTGELYMRGGGANTGDILADPGTLLSLVGSHEMLVGSTLTADDVYGFSGTSNIRGDVNITGNLTFDSGALTFTNEASVTSYGQDLFARRGLVHFESPTAGPSLEFNSVTIGEAGLSGGTEAYFNTGQPVNINTLAVVKGNLNGADSVAVNDSFTWNSGSINAGGDITVNGTSTVNSNGNTRNLYRNLHNAATLTFLGGGISVSNADFNNLATGIIDIRTDGTKFGLSTTATLYNSGALIKSAGVGVSTINNHFRNAGVVEVQTGVLEFYGSYSLTHVQTAGQTVLNGGDLSITSPGVYELQGGDLLGVGIVTGEVDNAAGTIKPGLSAGVLTIDGDYTQQAGGALEVELGGTNLGEFDVLNISGTAALAGDLNISLINGYSPMGGDSFVVLSAAAINGLFDTVSGASGFDVTYTPTEVILTATGASLPGDLDGDCEVGLSDLATLLASYAQPGPWTYEDGDLDGDSDVDLADLATLLAVYGTVCE